MIITNLIKLINYVHIVGILTNAACTVSIMEICGRKLFIAIFLEYCFMVNLEVTAVMYG